MKKAILVFVEVPDNNPMEGEFTIFKALNENPKTGKVKTKDVTKELGGGG